MCYKCVIITMVIMMNKKKKIIILCVVLALIITFIIFMICFNNEKDYVEETSSCVDNVKLVSDLSINNSIMLSDSDTNQYKIENNTELAKTVNLLKDVSKIDYLKLKLCYEIIDDEKVIKDFEVLNTKNKDIIKSDNISALINLLGYHDYGNYTENLIYLGGSELPGSGISDKGSFIYHNLMFKFEDGREIEMRYEVYDENKDIFSSLEKNKMYSVDFDVVDGSFDKVEYLINNIK